MSSTITLYEVEELNKDKNFIIEDLEGFISAYVDHSHSVSTGQYFKHSLVTSIKLPLEQDYFYTKIIKYNYCKIENSETTSGYTPYPVYYYIDSIEWLSKTTIKLNLTMDTLNTFKPVSDYQLSKKTLVKREHKDRYKIIEGNKIRKIDIINEGINPNLFKVSETDLVRRNYPYSWYLVYQNNDAINPDSYNQVNPVSCYLVPEYDLEIIYDNTEHEIDLSTFNDGAWYTFNPIYNANVSTRDEACQMVIYLNNVEYILSKEASWHGLNNPKCINLQLNYSNGQLKGYIYQTSFLYENLIKVIDVSSFKIPALSFVRYRRTTGRPEKYVPDYGEQNNTINFTTTTGTLKGIQSIDKTDPKLVKILKLPYCPIPYGAQLSGEVTTYYFDSNWYFDSGKLKLRYLNTKFNNEMNSTENKIFDVMKLTHTISATDDASMEYESKLYSSEFYQPQFVYDSFVFQFNLELLDIDNLSNIDNLEIRYVVTTTINSRFLFQFPQYKLKYSTENYDNILSVNRNNEVTIYSSQYINYIKTGYNYDVKTKNLQNVESIVGLGLGLGTGIGQTALGIGGFSAKSIWGATNITRGITGAGNSLLQNITNMIYRQYDFEKNIVQKQNEATSVRGSDDIDLLEAYSNNKAKTCIYQVTDVMKSYVYELFRYYGYACNEIKKPVTDTRIWYNFLQADVDFEMVDIKIEQDILEEIKSKYAQGVTFIHKYNNDWNITQTYENWETLFFS